MRVSFDLDNTIVCGPAVPREFVVPWWLAWYFREPVRRGTSGLLRELMARECEVWVYTTSFRSAGYVRGWFGSFGVRLGGVVNQQRHLAEVGEQGPSKLPSAFGIDLHIDDSEGVGIEGRRHGFQVLVVRPEESDWTDHILAAVRSLRVEAYECRKSLPNKHLPRQ
jgi:hypothetical protein